MHYRDTLMFSTHCPAIFLAAPASGQGKTTITAALARLLKRQGKIISVFKTGPDYLDPQILEQASGNPVVQLDLWMAGEEYCRKELYQAACVSDLIIIEGAMGIFDGEPSSADLAAKFGIPLVLIMDVKGMAQTAAAIAKGIANYRQDISVIGLIANNCSTDRHRQLIEEALPSNLPLLATLKNASEVALPERHLGLVQAQEISSELENRFEAGADWLEGAGVLNWSNNIETINFHNTTLAKAPALLSNKVIAIAKDTAFSFIYAVNLKLLEDMGATLQFFSPLNDKTIPNADALWLPGGYPELYAKELSENSAMIESIKSFHQNNKPILAECGGFLYCLDSLSDTHNKRYKMTGLLKGEGSMRGTRGCQGMQSAPLPEGVIRGHAHHHSISNSTPEPIAHGLRQRHPAPGEAIYREGTLTASYLHLFFPSNPEAVAALFSA